MHIDGFSRHTPNRATHSLTSSVGVGFSIVVDPPHTGRYLVGPEKKKQHLRIYYAAFSPLGTDAIRFIVYNDGWLALTPKPYDPRGTDKDTQISRDRDCRLSEWDEFPPLKPKLHELLVELSQVGWLDVAPSPTRTVPTTLLVDMAALNVACDLALFIPTTMLIAHCIWWCRRCAPS